ncbi:hypothetical protein DID80_03005 [Candidatus Marinamargulisbacteria bacterium SCGC AAA071-K20]|nr:hypothetical protein DID80_03005 [Candidatus Marinamargulisbacteria bacterium SCGC AAA071-K20]
MKRLLSLAVLASLIILFLMIVLYDVREMINLHSLKESISFFESYYQNFPIRFIVYYSLLFLFFTVSTLPLTFFLILLGGAILSPFITTLIAVLALGIGSSLSFLFVRYVCFDWVKKHFNSKLDSVNKHLLDDGFFYVVFIRFIPGLPLFLINILFAVTELKFNHFLFGTMIGAAFPVYVFAKTGLTLSSLTSINDIYTQDTIITFALIAFLAAVPIVYKYFKRKKAQ